MFRISVTLLLMLSVFVVSCRNCAYTRIPELSSISRADKSHLEDLRQINVRVINSLERGHGSGVLLGMSVDQRLVILTAAHVVGSASRLEVGLVCQDSKVETVAVAPIAIKRSKDLAVLVSKSGYRGGCMFTQAKIAEQFPSIASKVYAVGDPVVGHSVVTEGVLTVDNLSFLGTNAFLIDASIGPGYSGGGVYNEKHELIGITVATYFPSYLNQGVVVSLKEVIPFLQEVYSRFPIL